MQQMKMFDTPLFLLVSRMETLVLIIILLCIHIAYYIFHTVHGPTAVLSTSRQGHSGRYRGQVNKMYQDKVITKPEIEEIDNRNESGGVTGYTGIVRFEIVATGEKKAFSGSGPSKSAAHEDAAQTAVNEISKHTHCEH